MLACEERIRRRVYLLTAFLLGCALFFGMYRHYRRQVKPSVEMKQGVKVLTDPEAVVKDIVN